MRRAAAAASAAAHRALRGHALAPFAAAAAGHACSCCWRWRMAAVFLGGMQRALSDRLARRGAAAGGRLRGPAGGRDRLAARRRARARRWSARLPMSIRIDGPEVNWESHPDGRTPALARLATTARAGELARPHHRRRPPHRASAWAPLPWQREPRGIGWITLALLLVLIAAGLCLRAPPAAAAGRHPRRRRALRPRRLRPADPAAPARRTGRPGAAHQHHGARHPRHARRQARAAAGAQPRAALAADARAAQRRAAARHARRRGRARRRCCATWPRCAT